MWRKLLEPCQPSVFLAKLGKAAKQVRWNHGRKKGQGRADVVQKKEVLWNSKTLIFTPKILKSIRRHNARSFFEISECRFYHGCLGVVHQVVAKFAKVSNGMLVISWPVPSKCVATRAKKTETETCAVWFLPIHMIFFQPFDDLNVNGVYCTWSFFGFCIYRNLPVSDHQIRPLFSAFGLILCPWLVLTVTAPGVNQNLQNILVAAHTLKYGCMATALGWHAQSQKLDHLNSVAWKESMSCDTQMCESSWGPGSRKKASSERRLFCMVAEPVPLALATPFAVIHWLWRWRQLQTGLGCSGPTWNISGLCWTPVCILVIRSICTRGTYSFWKWQGFSIWTLVGFGVLLQ